MYSLFVQEYGVYHTVSSRSSCFDFAPLDWILNIPGSRSEKQHANSVAAIGIIQFAGHIANR